MMIRSTAGKSSVKMASRFAYAAGVTGILANLFLIAFFALQSTHPDDGFSLGSANDIVGSLAAAFMIPVAFALGGRLPQRRVASFTQAAGLTAMAFLSVGGPLLVLGVLAFEVATPIAMAAWIILSLWLLLVNRWLRLSDALRPRLTRLGEYLGAGTLAGYVIVGLGLLLPWMSWPQLVVFGVGGLIGLPAWLGIPVWFVVLGRYLAAS
jgi:MFS family permease